MFLWLTKKIVYRIKSYEKKTKWMIHVTFPTFCRFPFLEPSLLLLWDELPDTLCSALSSSSSSEPDSLPESEPLSSEFDESEELPEPLSDPDSSALDLLSSLSLLSLSESPESSPDLLSASESFASLDLSSFSEFAAPDLLWLSESSLPSLSDPLPDADASSSLSDPLSSRYCKKWSKILKSLST